MCRRAGREGSTKSTMATRNPTLQAVHQTDIHTHARTRLKILPCRNLVAGLKTVILTKIIILSAKMTKGVRLVIQLGGYLGYHIPDLINMHECPEGLCRTVSFGAPSLIWAACHLGITTVPFKRTPLSVLLT